MPARKFLAPGAVAGNGHGYRSQPGRPLPLVADETDTLERIRDASNINDEPESDSEALADFAKTAKYYQTLRHQKTVEEARKVRPLLATEDRIKDAERRARQAHRNLSGEFHVMRQMLERARKGGRNASPSLIRRLERVEATLDGVKADGTPLAA